MASIRLVVVGPDGNPCFVCCPGTWLGGCIVEQCNVTVYRSSDGGCDGTWWSLLVEVGS